MTSEILEEKKLTTPQEEELIAIYNNSNEIFGIGKGQLLVPRGNARVRKSVADYLLKYHKHAIHRQFIEKDDTAAKLATEKQQLAEELATAKAELAKLKNGEIVESKSKKKGEMKTEPEIE